MYLLVGGVVAAGIIGVYAWLSGEEKAAYDDYQNTKERVYHEARLRQQQIHSLRQRNQLAQEYYKYIELHYQAIQTADNCYDIYNQQKQILNMLYQKKQNLGGCIGHLKKQRDAASAANKQAIIKELKIIRQCFKEVKEEIEKIKQEKEKNLQQVRQLNQATREFKLYIRDNCGQKGREWYQRRLQSKK